MQNSERERNVGSEFILCDSLIFLLHSLRGPENIFSQPCIKKYFIVEKKKKEEEEEAGLTTTIDTAS